MSEETVSVTMEMTLVLNDNGVKLVGAIEPDLPGLMEQIESGAVHPPQGVLDYLVHPTVQACVAAWYAAMGAAQGVLDSYMGDPLSRYSTAGDEEMLAREKAQGVTDEELERAAKG